MKRNLFALLLALAMILGLTACGGGGAATPTPAPAGTPSAAPGGSAQSTPAPEVPAERVEITAGFGLTPNGLDPISEDQNTTMSITFLIYDHLVELGDDDLSYIPGVAKSWKQIDDVTWEFEINMDYKFQNGDPLTMDDVVFSFERLRDIPKSADAASRMKSISYEGNILTIEINEPNNTSIPWLLWSCIIVNKAYIEATGDEGIYLKPIGTGPYMVTEFTPGSSVTVETWDGYPFEKPQIDIINFVNIPEDTNRFIGVESGQIQYAGLLTSFEADLAKNNPDLYTFSSGSVRGLCFAFNCQKAPFDDINVRRALVHAFDREAFCDLQGGRPAFKSMLFGGWDSLYVDPTTMPEYDLDKARELLEAAGYGPSNPLNISLLHFIPDPGLELYQSSLKQIGVEMTLNLVEFSVYLAGEQEDFDMLWTSQPTRAGFPLTDLDRFDPAFIGSRNLGRWNNAEFMEIAQRMRVSTDDAELKELAAQATEILCYEVPMFGAYLQPIYSIMDANLTGVIVRPDFIQNFRNAVYNG